MDIIFLAVFLSILGMTGAILATVLALYARQE